MIAIPALAYALAYAFIGLALALAAENTIISAEVLHNVSGASVIASGAIAISTSGLELFFASWVMREDSMTAVAEKLRKNPAPTIARLFFGGLGLGLVYHFDIYTTFRHPAFHTEDMYFFSVVVAAFVFGPEVILCIGWWLLHRAQEEETKLLAATNHKAAENAYRHSERTRLVSLAKAAGAAHADSRASNRWGPGADRDRLN
jgi:hypothetical protein